MLVDVWVSIEIPQGSVKESTSPAHLQKCKDVPTRRFRVVWVCVELKSFLLALRCRKQMEPETMFTLVSQL